MDAAGYQQDTSCALQLLHGCMEISVSHMGKLVHTTMDEETLESSHSSLDHGPKLFLHRDICCLCLLRSYFSTVWLQICSLCVSCFFVPGCQESHLPKRLCPQNTFLLPPAASHKND